MKQKGAPKSARKVVASPRPGRKLRRIVHLELDRMRGVLEADHLLHLQLDVAVDEVVVEHAAGLEEGAVGICLSSPFGRSWRSLSIAGSGSSFFLTPSSAGERLRLMGRLTYLAMLNKDAGRGGWGGIKSKAAGKTPPLRQANHVKKCGIETKSCEKRWQTLLISPWGAPHANIINL